MNGATLLYRQVHPSFIQAGNVTSQAFRPTPKDNYQLSAYDGDMISGEASWLHYTTQLKYQSGGVMALTVAECQQEDLPAVSDPAPFPEHVLVDFSAFEKSLEKKSKSLKALATKRGWLHRAPSV